MTTPEDIRYAHMLIDALFERATRIEGLLREGITPAAQLELDRELANLRQELKALRGRLPKREAAERWREEE